jgi:exopolysaccharide biosynthesis polyprenyl glycosylphosphotransferase
VSTIQGSITTEPTRASLRRTENVLLIGSLFLTDMLVIVGSFVLAYMTRFVIAESSFNEGYREWSYYSQFIFLVVPGQLVLFYIYGLYQRINLLGGTAEYARLFNAATTGAMLIIVASFFRPDLIIARGWLALLWASIVVGGITTRFIVRRVVYQLRRRGHFLERTLIVGANPEGLAVAQQLSQARTSGAQIIGFIDDYLSVGSEPLRGLPVLGSSQVFSSLVRQQQIENVVIANTAITREKLLGIYGALDTLGSVNVMLASGLFELLTTGVSVREEGHVPLVVVNKTRITGVHYVFKTLLDYSLALGGLLVLMPVWLALAVLIRLDSPGPIIYRRRVVGVGKQEFDAFKFRTMHLNGNRLLTPEQQAELHAEGKLKNDPRVTRVGVILRKYSLDELPQLINVLLGQMSLIGPRMITRAELEKFGKWQHNLLTVKPGLTGLWQISGRSDLSYEDRVRLDMHYIRNHTVWLDLHILIQTVPALLFHRGAY